MWAEPGLLAVSSPELLEAPLSDSDDSASFLTRLSTFVLRVVTMAVAAKQQKTRKKQG